MELEAIYGRERERERERDKEAIEREERRITTVDVIGRKGRPQARGEGRGVGTQGREGVHRRQSPSPR